MKMSDPEAVVVADRVMDAMGGRKHWDNTRLICWNFFDRRDLIWDKLTGDVRIQSSNDNTLYLLNINTMEGRVMRDGEEMTDPDSLRKYVERGKRIWINDSYWLVMPYKMKDSGVTLKYMGEDESESGLTCDVVQMTFEDVGVTPYNKYLVWVDKASSLVRQWAYFQYDTLDAPRWVRPWDDWAQHGDVLLSANRGDRAVNNIHVFAELPEKVFTSFEPVFLPVDQ